MIRRLSRLTLMLAVSVMVLPGASAPAGAEAGNELFWKTANFILLVILAVYFLRKPLRKFFQSRTEEIRKGITEAARIREDAEKRAAEMDRRLKNLDAEIASLRESVGKELAAEQSRWKTETEQSLARMQANAKQEIVSAAKQARQQLKAYSTELALELAREKIRTRMTPEVSRRLVDSFVDELGRLPRRVN